MPLNLKPIALLGLLLASNVFAKHVEKSWDEAVVYMPGKSFTTSVKRSLLISRCL
jgi:hypothetical protein